MGAEHRGLYASAPVCAGVVMVGAKSTLRVTLARKGFINIEVRVTPGPPWGRDKRCISLLVGEDLVDYKIVETIGATSGVARINNTVPIGCTKGWEGP